MTTPLGLNTVGRPFGAAKTAGNQPTPGAGTRRPLGPRTLGRPFGRGWVAEDEPAPADLPADLAAAIVARFDAAAIPGINQIYRDEAPETDAGRMPYLIFTLARGSTLRSDSSHVWYDHRARFTVYAEDSGVANGLIPLVWAALANRTYDFAGGFSIPFFKSDHFEGKDRGRTVGNKQVYKAGFEVMARVCRDAYPI